MRNNSISISTGNVTGFGVGPISNENTLIKFVLKMSKKLSIWVKQFPSKTRGHSTQKPHQRYEVTDPLFI